MAESAGLQFIFPASEFPPLADIRLVHILKAGCLEGLFLAAIARRESGMPTSGMSLILAPLLHYLHAHLSVSHRPIGKIILA